MNERIVYIGNWGRMGTRGISICRYQEQTGELTLIKTIFEAARVGNMCINRTNHTLYFTDESPCLPALKSGGGRILACRMDPTTGDLTKLCEKETFATLPDHLVIDDTGKFLLVVHHGHDIPVTKIGRDAYGNYYPQIVFDDVPTMLYPLQEDGTIGDPCDMFLHSVTGTGLTFQPPHVHYIGKSPCHGLFAACDKGTGQICFFRLLENEKKIILCGGKGIPAMPGGAPRYGAFHPTKPFFYANNESLPFISVFLYQNDGSAERIEDCIILPSYIEAKPEYQQSDIRIHPNGRFIYTLIREINAISVCEVKTDGTLTLVQFVIMEGSRGPRGCEISPNGRHLLVAAQESEEVITYFIEKNGQLSYHGGKISLPCPGSLIFA